MLRFRRRNTIRALCLFVVICLFFYNVHLGWAGRLAKERLGENAGKSGDVLRFVNMFIGTKNGGECNDFADFRKSMLSS